MTITDAYSFERHRDTSQGRLPQTSSDAFGLAALLGSWSSPLEVDVEGNMVPSGCWLQTFHDSIQYLGLSNHLMFSNIPNMFSTKHQLLLQGVHTPLQGQRILRCQGHMRSRDPGSTPKWIFHKGMKDILDIWNVVYQCLSWISWDFQPESNQNLTQGPNHIPNMSQHILFLEVGMEVSYDWW